MRARVGRVLAQAPRSQLPSGGASGLQSPLEACCRSSVGGCGSRQPQAAEPPARTAHILISAFPLYLSALEFVDPTPRSCRSRPPHSMGSDSPSRGKQHGAPRAQAGEQAHGCRCIFAPTALGLFPRCRTRLGAPTPRPPLSPIPAAAARARGSVNRTSPCSSGRSIVFYSNKLQLSSLQRL